MLLARGAAATFIYNEPLSLVVDAPPLSYSAYPFTGLHLAVARDDSITVQMLLRHRAACNTVDGNGTTASFGLYRFLILFCAAGDLTIHLASRIGAQWVAKALIEAHPRGWLCSFVFLAVA